MYYTTTIISGEPIKTISALQQPSVGSKGLGQNNKLCAFGRKWFIKQSKRANPIGGLANNVYELEMITEIFPKESSPI